MILLPHLEGKNFSVVGLGRSGISVIESLLQSGAFVFAWDDNETTRKTVESTYNEHTNFHHIHPSIYEWENLDGLILSPGIPLNFPKPHWIVELATENGCRILSDIELFLEYIFLHQNSSKVICITGTNGKSTTTSLINHFLNASGLNSELGGNIGIPVLKMEPNRNVYVVEISSFQIELTKNLNKVHASVFLNLTPDHIDRHGSFENYADVKISLIEQTNNSVIGCSTDIMKNICLKLNGAKITLISCSEILTSGISVIQNILYENSNVVTQLDMKINHITNAENIAASYAICKIYFNLEKSLILQSLKTFQGLPHRNELLGKIGNILFVNDSKSTNAASSEKTLLAWTNVFWILGGIDKEEGIEPLVNNSEILFQNIQKVYLIGKATQRFGKNLDGILEFVNCENLASAGKLAFNDAQILEREGTILLSPCCASFDQFKNFEDRGEKFRLMYEELSISINK